MTDDVPARPAFTWGETADVTWLRNDDGEYKRVDRSFLDTLLDVAEGERSVEDLSPDERDAVELLVDEGYLRPDGDVTEWEAPEDVALRPRVAAFALAFALLTAYVAYRLFLAGTTVPTVATVDVDVFGQLLLSVPVFVALALVHEAGHYLAARPYFDATVEFTLLNRVFPALVTKTNDAWRCPRNVRLWINLAGPFADCCQCLVLAAASLALFPDSYLLAVVPVFEYFRILFSLNPLVRGDGYWVVVDWFGLPNLHTRGVESLKRLEITLGSAYVFASGAFTLGTVGLMLYALSTLAGLA